MPVPLQAPDHYLQFALPRAGFGHPLYPDGGPLASALLSLFEPPVRSPAVN